MTIKAARSKALRPAKDESKAGTTVRATTASERVADMRAFGAERGSSRAAALSFLQDAGIITPAGKLAKPFRAA